MDLQQLHCRTGISRRKLRYCLDHELIPGVKIDLAPREAGQPRQFHEDVGVGIVCAVHLLELGIRHKKIRLFLGGLAEIPFPGRGRPKSLLAVLMERPIDVFARFYADQSIRILIEEINHDSLWWEGNRIDHPQGAGPPNFITLDLRAIRDQVFGDV